LLARAWYTTIDWDQWWRWSLTATVDHYWSTIARASVGTNVVTSTPDQYPRTGHQWSPSMQTSPAIAVRAVTIGSLVRFPMSPMVGTQCRCQVSVSVSLSLSGPVLGPLPRTTTPDHYPGPLPRTTTPDHYPGPVTNGRHQC